jgi:hypothetical protein
MAQSTVILPEPGGADDLENDAAKMAAGELALVG